MRFFSPSQCRAARALLRMTLPELAQKSGVSMRAISHFEAGDHIPRKLDDIVRVLTEAGIEFLHDARGEGVILLRRVAKPMAQFPGPAAPAPGRVEVADAPAAAEKVERVGRGAERRG